jgi:RHS repeat-associated protein
MNLCAWLALAGWFFVPSESLATRLFGTAVMTATGSGTGPLDPTGPLSLSGGSLPTTYYAWDLQNRLVGVHMPDGKDYGNQYDYRGRRLGISEGGEATPLHTAVVFSEGLSVAEYERPTAEATLATPTVEYVRGTDMGGGIGGMLYSVRSADPAPVKYSLSNGRGDIVAQSDQSAALTWTASYEAFGKRTAETGDNQDKQRANTKDEDPTGLLNEGYRYRDLETGVFLSRDPAGFVDGPNLYAYVRQNPWTSFDPKGLYAGRVVGAAARETIKRQAKTMVKDAVKDAFKDALYDKALGEYGGVLGPAAEAKINKALKKLDRKGKWTEWLDPTGIYSAKKDFDHMNKVVDEVFSEVQDLVNSARKTTGKSKGMAKKMHPLDADAKPYPDITGKEYKGEMKPETLVNDHKKARALGGEDASHNIDKETWETNSRKAGFEGNIAKDRQKMIDAGMDPADVDKALSPEMKWIQNDIHPVPVAPAKLNPLPQQ